jgi:hypothetical protein
LLLVIAGAGDREAHAAVAALGTERAILLDPRDLSRPGWLLRPGRQDGHIIACGRRIGVESISGVLTRRAAIYPEELTHVAEPDRHYVAAEMTALLIWWLGTLPAEVLNRPGCGTICGPGWRVERWLARAAALGIPVASEPAPVAAEAVIIGDAVIGAVSGILAEHMRELVRAAAAPLLWAAFDDAGPSGKLIAVHSFPPLTTDVLFAIGRYVGLR